MAVTTPPLDVQFDRSGPQLTVYLAGELDANTAPDLEAQVGPRIDDTVKAVWIDIAALTFCDSTGLRAFVSINERAAACGAEFVLYQPSSIIRRLLEVTGLASTLTTSGRQPS